MNVTTYTITYTVHNGMQWPREWPKTNGEAAHATINLLDNALSLDYTELSVLLRGCVCVCVYSHEHTHEQFPAPRKTHFELTNTISHLKMYHTNMEILEVSVFIG